MSRRRSNTPDPVDETAWLQAFADSTGYPHGIVAECHLARPDAAEVLDRHLQFANVRGIRNFGEGRYLVDPAWRKGFAELGPRQLVSCIDTRVELAADIADLAREFSRHARSASIIAPYRWRATRPLSSAGGRRWT